MSARFLYIFSLGGHERAVLSHDDPLTKDQMRGAGRLVWRARLGPEVDHLSRLDDLKAWYRQNLEFGTLPPDNMVPPRAAKRDDRGVMLDIERRESPVDFARRQTGRGE